MSYESGPKLSLKELVGEERMKKFESAIQGWFGGTNPFATKNPVIMIKNPEFIPDFCREIERRVKEDNADKDDSEKYGLEILDFTKDPEALIARVNHLFSERRAWKRGERNGYRVLIISPRHDPEGGLDMERMRHISIVKYHETIVIMPEVNPSNIPRPELELIGGYMGPQTNI